jgi:hypothetical protein
VQTLLAQPPLSISRFSLHEAQSAQSDANRFVLGGMLSLASDVSHPCHLALRLREFRGGALEKFTGLLTTINSPELPEVEQLLLARIEAGQVVRFD